MSCIPTLDFICVFGEVRELSSSFSSSLSIFFLNKICGFHFLWLYYSFFLIILLNNVFFLFIFIINLLEGEHILL